MKKLFFIIGALLFLFASNAQDIIIMRDATEVKAKVLQVTDTQISYKQFDNLDGPTYFKSRSEIFFVKYANGTKEVFNVFPTDNSTSADDFKFRKKSTSRDSLKKIDIIMERPFIKKPMFDGYVEGCYSLFGNLINEKSTMGFGLTVSVGCRLFDYVYMGVLVGMKYYLGGYYGQHVFIFPFQYDFRFYYPIKRRTHYYLNLAVGPGIGIENYTQYFSHTDIYAGALSWFTPSFLFATGFDFNRFTLGLTYEYYYRGQIPHFAGIKMGVRLGKNYLLISSENEKR